MEISWYGHAAFLVEACSLRIILDPFKSPDSGGYEPIAEPADLVVVSHENDRYHSHLGQIVPPFEVVRGLEVPPEGRLAKGIRLDVLRVFESPEKRPDEEVTIVHFWAEGKHLVFLGDLGHRLEEDEVAPLRGADVLMVPAGGKPTIELAEVPRLIEAIGPKLIVPMHYLTPRINLKIEPVEKFLGCLPDWPVDRRESCSFRPGGDRRIVVLDHAR